MNNVKCGLLQHSKKEMCALKKRLDKFEFINLISEEFAAPTFTISVLVP